MLAFLDPAASDVKMGHQLIREKQLQHFQFHSLGVYPKLTSLAIPPQKYPVTQNIT